MKSREKSTLGYYLSLYFWLSLTIANNLRRFLSRSSIGMTGVLRSHRRKGIATALKLQGIEYAKQNGIKYLKTENEENNPMYQINLKLGFRPQRTWTDFEKQLRDESVKE